MSHHYSTISPGPQFGFPYGDARLDYTDLFAFPKPEIPAIDPHDGRAPVLRRD